MINKLKSRLQINISMKDENLYTSFFANSIIIKL